MENGVEQAVVLKKEKQNPENQDEMVFVFGGDFIMGGNDDVVDDGHPELRIADECPHLVKVETFSISRYEVTQVDWFQIMGTYPSKHEDCAEYRVEQVSWDDVQEFISKLNLMHNDNYRLPTEEEGSMLQEEEQKVTTISIQAVMMPLM